MQTKDVIDMKKWGKEPFLLTDTNDSLLMGATKVGKIEPFEIKKKK